MVAPKDHLPGARQKTSNHDRSDDTDKSWRAPATILFAFALGLGVAVAHHLMGLSLDKRPVDQVPVSQGWIARFSSALAFLVKMALATAVGTAYIQHQRLRFREQSFETRAVDILTSVLGNAFSFLHVEMARASSSGIDGFDIMVQCFTSHLSSVLLADLFFRGRPLAAVVAPDSLTVLAMHRTDVASTQVPQLFFNQLDGLRHSIRAQAGEVYRFKNPQSGLPVRCLRGSVTFDFDRSKRNVPLEF